MNSKVLLLMCSVFLFGISANAGEKEQKNRKTTVFNVNVHCVSCQQKIEKNISFEKGVKDLVVNMDAKTVAVTYDPRKTSDEKLVEAFNKIGYQAVPTPSGCCGKSDKCGYGECKKPCAKGEEPEQSKCDKPCDKKSGKDCCGDKKE